MNFFVYTLYSKLERNCKKQKNASRCINCFNSIFALPLIFIHSKYLKILIVFRLIAFCYFLCYHVKKNIIINYNNVI